MDVTGGESLAEELMEQAWDGRGTKKTLGAIHQVAPLLCGGRPGLPLGITFGGQLLHFGRMVGA